MPAMGPGSAAWRNALDWRLLLGSGRALLLQVAHPTVDAGVAQHSNFRAEPWFLPDVAWRLAGPAVSKAMMTATVGTLPPEFRNRLGLLWTTKDERRLRALSRTVRAGMPIVPPKLRYHPMALAARRCSI